MRTIITLGIGFWMGRQLYINYDKRVAYKKEAQVKKRLVEFIEKNKVNVTNPKMKVDQLFSN